MFAWIGSNFHFHSNFIFDNEIQPTMTDDKNENMRQIQHYPIVMTYINSHSIFNVL